MKERRAEEPRGDVRDALLRNVSCEPSRNAKLNGRFLERCRQYGVMSVRAPLVLANATADEDIGKAC